MANDLTYNPWVIDTPSAVPVTLDQVYVKSIRWVAEGAAGGNNVLVVAGHDATKVLWDSVASGANYTEEAIIEGRWPNGFAVTVLDAGKLYVTYG